MTPYIVSAVSVDLCVLRGLLFWHVLACRCFLLSRIHTFKHGVYFPRKSKNRFLAKYIYELYLNSTHVFHLTNKRFVCVSSYSHTNELRRVYTRRLWTFIDCQRSEMRCLFTVRVALIFLTSLVCGLCNYIIKHSPWYFIIHCSRSSE